jgi:hypothetical protein
MWEEEEEGGEEFISSGNWKSKHRCGEAGTTVG